MWWRQASSNSFLARPTMKTPDKFLYCCTSRTKAFTNALQSQLLMPSICLCAASLKNVDETLDQIRCLVWMGSLSI